MTRAFPVQTAAGRIGLRFLAVLLLMTNLTAVASAGQLREPISGAALTELTGVDRTLDEVYGSIADQGEAIAAEGEAIGDKVGFVSAWRKAAEITFAPAKLRSAFATRMTGKLAAEHALAVEDFYRSELGQRLVTAETAATTPAAQQEMMDSAQALMQQLLEDPNRQAALDRINRSVKLEEMAVNLALNVSRALLIGLATTDTAATRMSLEDIIRAIDEQKPQIEVETGAMTQLSLAFAYRNLDVADLDGYAEFLETPAGASYSDAVMKSLDAVMSEASLAFGRALSSDMNKQPI